MRKGYEVVVIGGGVVGLACAYGLAKRNVKVAVLDEGDIAFRASRSNFGLVWFQGKGVGSPAYVRWVNRAISNWSSFADELTRESGVNVGYRKPGGLALCVGEQEAQRRKAHIDTLRRQSEQQKYDCRFLSRRELEELFHPVRLGHDVHTASYCPADGHVNPLYLLFAMRKRLKDMGGDFHGNQHVRDVSAVSGGGFELSTKTARFGCEKVVLAAGLGTPDLASKLDLQIPMRAERGHILVTQRTRAWFPLPMNGFRQTEEGSILLGHSKEDAGLDDASSTAVASRIARDAVKAFPELEKLRLIRIWAGLRTLSPDSYPIYAESQRHPGAYAAICHSGITLASAHAEDLPEWILSGQAPPDMSAFGLGRFDVQVH